MHNLGNVLLTLSYVLTSVAGLTLIKHGGRSLLAGFALYLIGFGMWYWILLRLPLSQAFPIAAGALIIGTQLSGWLVLGEPIDMRQAAGIILVLAGITILFWRSSTTT